MNVSSGEAGYLSNSSCYPDGQDLPRVNDATYAFLKKKLDDANCLISGFTEKEVAYKLEIERLKEAKDGETKKTAEYRQEIQNVRVKMLDVDQRLDKENRIRISTQDKLSEKETELNSERMKSQRLALELKRKLSELKNADSTAKELKSIANESCAQTGILKEQVQIYEKMLRKSGDQLMSLKDRLRQNCAQCQSYKVDHDHLKENFADTYSEVELMKLEACKQKDYFDLCNEKLKDMWTKFSNTQSWFTQNQQMFEEKYIELSNKLEAEKGKNAEVSEQLKHMGHANQKTSFQ